MRVLKTDAEQLPKIRTDLEIIHKAYNPREKSERLEYTNLVFSGDTVNLAIGDSKEGWAQAIDHYFQILTNQEYSRIRRIVVEYDSIRPRGERLKVFGGTASGYESMLTMLDKIHRVIRSAGLRDGKERTNLRPIDLLDIANIIGRKRGFPAACAALRKLASSTRTTPSASRQGQSLSPSGRPLGD